ncbi:hypothetical protein M0R45_008039 [Rubus argutus]|uniref:Endonuclease/exonuclease/phosphatase domain-containing protein n=1 Tax=Rubus argutus TaxID=59490 RepID=A0AAW1Y1Z2_RUBAR
MNLMAWNCQGIANRKTRHACKLLIQKHQINLVFLSETHCTKAQHTTLPKALGLPHMVHFDRINQAGGVAMLWDDSVIVNVRHVDFFFIDIDITLPGGRNLAFYWVLRTSRNWTTTCFLGPPSFLGILGQMQAFRDALSDCNLEDLGAVGGSFYLE